MTLVSAPRAPSPERPGRRPAGLPFLDGMRALAALAVVLNHAYTASGRSGDAERDLPAALERLNLGQFAVPAFLVLSGFVLALPVAGAPGLELRGGVRRFLQRRARRLLPPYAASLLLGGLLIATVPLLRTEHGTAWDSRIPVTVGGVVSHALLVHPLQPEWRLQLNGPAWSISTEWWAYVLLALVLVPVWRRWGLWAVVAVAAALGWGLPRALPVLDGAHPWLLLDFAAGVLAAALVRRPGTAAGAVAGRVALVGVPLAAAALLAVPDPLRAWERLTDVVVGVLVAAVVVWLAAEPGATTAPRVRSAVRAALESRPLVWVGLWSYSLYLVHSPVLNLGNLLLLDADLSTAQRFALQLGVWVPLALVVSYGFHRLVERRFLTTHQRGTAR